MNYTSGFINMFDSIPYGYILVTVLVVLAFIFLLVIYPNGDRTLVTWRKRFEYYRKRRQIDKTFKRAFNKMATATYIQSFVDLPGALRIAIATYEGLGVTRENRMIDLVNEYQPYFERELRIRNANEIV